MRRPQRGVFIMCGKVPISKRNLICRAEFFAQEAGLLLCTLVSGPATQKIYSVVLFLEAAEKKGGHVAL